MVGIQIPTVIYICGLDLHWFVLGNCCGSNLFSNLHRSGRPQASATQASYWKRIGRFWNQVWYINHPNTGHLNTRSIWIPDVFVSIFNGFWKPGSHLSGFQMTRLRDFRSHSKSRLFANQHGVRASNCPDFGWSSKNWTSSQKLINHFFILDILSSFRMAH